MSVPSQELEDLHPRVQAVADVHAIVFVDVNAHGQVELSRLLAVGAHEHQHLAVRREDLNIVESGVNDPEVAFAVVGNTLGTNELAGPRALASDSAQEFQLGGKDLNGATAGVGHRDAAVR